MTKTILKKKKLYLEFDKMLKFWFHPNPSSPQKSLRVIYD